MRFPAYWFNRNWTPITPEQELRSLEHQRIAKTQELRGIERRIAELTEAIKEAE